MSKVILCSYCNKKIERKKFNKASKHHFCNSVCYHKFRYVLPKLITCTNCKKQFERKKFSKSKNFYCSKQCIADYRKGSSFIYPHKYTEIECENCNKFFKILKSELKNRGKRFCSNKCYFRFRANSKIVITCAYCSSEKEVYKKYVDRGQYKYCSDNCRQSDRRRGLTKKDLTKNCITCGEEYKIRPKEFFDSKINRQHCSKKCQRRVIKRVCAHCNIEFETKKSGNIKFCSKSCYSSYRGETSIEKIVRSYLEKIGITFKTQVQFENYVVDFLLPNHKKVIEADGDYWHSKDGVESRDKRKDIFLNKLGYKVIRLSEKSINSGEYKKDLECLN
jgi:very-short-patch-repair endonuclease